MNVGKCKARRSQVTGEVERGSSTAEMCEALWWVIAVVTKIVRQASAKIIVYMEDWSQCGTINLSAFSTSLGVRLYESLVILCGMYVWNCGHCLSHKTKSWKQCVTRFWANNLQQDTDLSERFVSQLLKSPTLYMGQSPDLYTCAQQCFHHPTELLDILCYIEYLILFASIINYRFWLPSCAVLSFTVSTLFFVYIVDIDTVDRRYVVILKL